MTKKHTKPNNPAEKQSSSAPASSVWTLFASQTFWLKLIIIGQMILLSMQFSPDISTNGDDAVYYIIGKSMATGQGYHNIHIVNHPVMTQYPAVLPALLSITDFFTDRLLYAKLIILCMGCLITLTAFYLFKRWTPNAALPLTLIIAVSSVLNQHAVQILSETPYILLSLLALLLFEKSVESPAKKWLFWLTVFVSILPMNCRSIGLSFSAAFMLATLLQKQYRYAAAHFVLLGTAAVLFKMATAWNNPYLVQLLQRNSYDPEQGLATMAEMVTRIVTNIVTYTTDILPHSILPSLTEAYAGPAKLIGSVLVVIMLIGFIRNLFLKSRIASLYALFYCGILSMWQAQWSSSRFLSGILPILFFLFIAGLTALQELLAKTEGASFIAGLRKKFTAALAPVSVLGIIGVWVLVLISASDSTAYQLRGNDPNRQLTADWINFYSCADWIRQNTPQSAIVVSRKAELVYLRAKREGMLYPYSHDPEKVIEAIKTNHASYIIFDSFFWTGTTGRYLYPALLRHPEMYRIVYALRNPDTYVLEIVKP
jgi:hypothetical protein